MEKVKKVIARITTFDLLRGYFLVAIIIDHLNFFPNGLDWWAARGGLFVTTAEGFFLISGIILGIVRGAKTTHLPFKTVVGLLAKRSLQLYLTLIVMVLLFTALGWYVFAGNTGLKWGIAPVESGWLNVIWQTLTLQYFYGWADYLRLYAIFIAAAIPAFWLLRRGKWYIVFVVSTLAWLLFPDPATLSGYQQELLQPLSWQFLFFIGAIIGFHWNEITGYWKRLAEKSKRIIITSVLSVSAITLLINVLIMLSTMGINLEAIGITPQLQERLYIGFFDKEQLPLARIMLALLWFWAAFYLFNKFEKPIIKALGWLLLPFGTNSLYVYTLHAMAIFLVHLFFVSGPIWFNFIVTVSIILIIRLCIHYKILMKIIPR